VKLTSAQAAVLRDVTRGREIVSSARAKRRRWRYVDKALADGRAVRGLLARGVLVERVQRNAEDKPRWRVLVIPNGSAVDARPTQPPLFPEEPPVTGTHPDVTASYHGGADTSNAAHRATGPAVRAAQRASILKALARYAVGATCDRLEQDTGLSHQSCSARISELARDGLIADTGSREKTRSGRTARVYRSTVAA
jgi:hypothetical protein